jgi:rod shape-determining protein MreC
MEYAPPPFFKQGPSALARFASFALLSLALLVLDARFKLLEQVRFGVAVLLYPLQVAARAPGDIASNLGGYMGRQQTLISENGRLERERLEAARGLMRNAQLEAENANLRQLLAMRERLPVVAVAAEMLYDARDPFTRKVIIDKGVMQQVRAGQVVVDAGGVMGQVTRAFPMVAEVSLLTDRDQAIPVQVVRNGLRAIAYGTPGGPEGGTMELKFLATNADVRQGDVLVTSGIDGTYLPGLPVATVLRIEREAGYAFAKILCKPAAGVDRFGHVLVLTGDKAVAPPPPPEADDKPVKGRRKRLRADMVEKDGAPRDAAGVDPARGDKAASAPGTTPATALPALAAPGTVRPATPSAPASPPSSAAKPANERK